MRLKFRLGVSDKVEGEALHLFMNKVFKYLLRILVYYRGAELLKIH